MHEKVESILQKHNTDPSGFSIVSGLPGVWTGRVNGAQATDVWLALRNAFEETSLWPVIRGEPGERETFPVDSGAILAAVRYAPLRDLLSFRLQEQCSFAAEIMALQIPADIDAPRLAQMLDASGAFELGGRKKPPDAWPAQPPATSKIEFVSTHSVQSHTTLPVVELSLVSLKHPYEVPAYLGFGGWNDCPAPEFQVAVLRDWFERYGAVPAVITGDVMECVVARPPTTEAESLELAADQWLFCDDIVSQGTMSIRRLAIEIWQRPKWFFWWD